MNINMHVDFKIITDYNFTVRLNATGTASNFDPESDHDYAISLFLSSLYAIFLLPVGFIGNILILVVNLTHRGALTAPDLYFVNLAAADVALVADSLIEVLNLKRGYYDKATLCTFMNIFQQVNMYSSVFFLTWMSFDRFVVLTSSMGRGIPRARLSCCLIWVFSCSLTMLPFAIAQVQHAGEKHFCFANVSQILWLEVTLGFLVPFCVLGVCYWRISQLLQEDSQQQRPRRQRALHMISAAVLVFFLCWLPENVFVSVHLLRRDARGSTLWQDYPVTGHAVKLAAFSNSCLNPIIYSLLGRTFQDKVRLFLQGKARWANINKSTSIRQPVLASSRQESSEGARQSGHLRSVCPQVVL